MKNSKATNSREYRKSKRKLQLVDLNKFYKQTPFPRTPSCQIFPSEGTHHKHN